MPNFPVNLGHVFTAKTNFSIDALGFYFGSGVTGPETVGLYNSSGTLLASAIVSLSDTVTDGYLFHRITPLAITAGQQYTVVAFTGNNDWSYGPTAPNQATDFVTYGHSDYQYGGNGGCLGTPGGPGCIAASGLSFTTQTLIIGTTVGAYYGPNFEIAGGQTPQVLPQLAFGGGWYTALYFTNISSAPASFTVEFIGNDGKPLTVPAVGGSSVTVNLNARGTDLIEIPNTGPLLQGYVSAALPAGVTGHGVFRQSIPGMNDQEAVVQFSGTAATTSTLLFDDTKYVTGVSVVNLASVSTTISVIVRDTQGNTIGTSGIPLAANAKAAVVLRDLAGLAGVAGTLGSVDFAAPIGSLAALGLRFNGSAFTSIPTSDR